MILSFLVYKSISSLKAFASEELPLLAFSKKSKSADNVACVAFKVTLQAFNIFKASVTLVPIICVKSWPKSLFKSEACLITVFVPFKIVWLSCANTLFNKACSCVKSFFASFKAFTCWVKNVTNLSLFISGIKTKSCVILASLLKDFNLSSASFNFALNSSIVLVVSSPKTSLFSNAIISFVNNFISSVAFLALSAVVLKVSNSAILAYLEASCFNSNIFLSIS